MTKKKKYITDDIPEKIHKRLHLTYFTVKMLVIGAIVFIVIQLLCGIFMMNDFADEDNENSVFVQHNYCGTFFIDQAEETKEAAMEILDSDDSSLAEDIIVNAALVILLVCIFLALRNGDKKAVFSRKTSRLFIIAGIVYALGNLWLELSSYTGMDKYKELYTGILSTQKYYLQLYNVLAIPAIILCCGLLLRQHERRLNKQDTKGNSAALRATAIAVLVIAFGFILYRFGVRVYELVMILAGEKMSVRLPFYSLLLELPYELAKTPGDYTELIVFRFVKDLPVFVASALTVIMFSKVLLSGANGNINTAVNRKRITVSIIALIISSLLFNVLGVFEVNMLRDGFTGIYSSATYTIGLRSLCEPMLYALVLWFFSSYIQCVPEENSPT